METVRKLMKELRELEKQGYDYGEKKEIFRKLKIIAKTLEKAEPVLEINTFKKMYSGRCVKLKLKGEKLEFAINDPNGIKNWKGEAKIPEELVDILLWQDKKENPLFWNDIFKAKLEVNNEM